MRVVVLQAVYGGYDRLTHWPEQDVPGGTVHRVVVTDAHPLQVRFADIPGRHVPVTVVSYPLRHMHPRMAAKVAKCQPWRFAGDADVVVWADGSVQPTDGQFVGHLLAYTQRGHVGWFAHPCRSTIMDEARASAVLPKYAGQRVMEQVEAYYADGYVDDGLWAAGIAVWRDPFGVETRRFGTMWLAEQVAWTYQDQLSLPYVLWRNPGILPVTIPGDLFAPEHYQLRPHVWSDR